MNIFSIITSLFISLMYLVSFPMDLPQNCNKSLGVLNNNYIAILHDLNNIINAKYPPLAHRDASAKDMIPCIVDILVMYKNPLTSEIFDGLCRKNHIFAQVTTYLIAIAYKNLQNITPETLTLIENPAKKQRAEILNALPKLFKLYVMSKALNKIEYSYKIKLSHTSPVLSADICATTHQAVTSTADGTLNLWDLKTGTCVYSFPKEDVVNEVCFNQDGTQLATATKFLGSSTIKIWNPQSKQLLHRIQDAPFLVTNLEYTTSLDYPTLCTYYFSHDSNLSATLWAVDHQQIRELGSLSIYPPLSNTMITKKNYSAKKPAYTAPNSKILTVSKNCPELKLCKQALEKAEKIEYVQEIKEGKTYTSLTPFEQSSLSRYIKKEYNLKK